MKTAYDYMIALTADERTPSGKAMVDIILLDAANAVDDISAQIAEARLEGYETGYEEGKEAAEQESA